MERKRSSKNRGMVIMSDFMPFYHCDECGEEVDAKDVTASGFPQKFFCPNCVYDFVEADR